MSNSAHSETGPAGYRDQFMLNMAAAIHHQGYMAIAVGSGACSVPDCECNDVGQAYTYTVGLVERGQPELVVLGATPDSSHFLIDYAVKQIYPGHSLAYNRKQMLNGHAFMLQQANYMWLAYDVDRMAMWVNHYASGRRELTLPQVTQIVWADSKNRFPGERGCDRSCVAAQPLLAKDPYSYPLRRNSEQDLE